MVALLRQLGRVHVGIQSLNALPGRIGEARDMVCAHILSHSQDSARRDPEEARSSYSKPAPAAQVLLQCDPS